MKDGMVKRATDGEKELWVDEAETIAVIVIRDRESPEMPLQQAFKWGDWEAVTDG